MLAWIKLKTISSCCKNGTNKERNALIRTSFGGTESKQMLAEVKLSNLKSSKKDEAIIYILVWSADSVWRENWLYLIKKYTDTAKSH